VSIVAFFGIFQLALTIPDDGADTVWENTTVDVVNVLIVTVTGSAGL
jgi:hypothetical protein